jgi:hypothetical protein
VEQPRLPLLIREYAGRRAYERHATLLLADGWRPWTVTERAGGGLLHTLTFGLWSRLFPDTASLCVTYASSKP